MRFIDNKMVQAAVIRELLKNGPEVSGNARLWRCEQQFCCSGENRLVELARVDVRIIRRVVCGVETGRNHLRRSALIDR
jgi:hypothetical protein